MLNQNFPVIYKSRQFMVDPVYLSHSSRKFHDLLQSLSNDSNEGKKMKLEIIYDHFSERNVENFLKLCQNLPTDCQNSEIKEICEIARMFQADQIYNTGINFVHQSIDRNYNVPEEKYNDRSFLILAPIVKKQHHFSDINSLDFDDDENKPPNMQENANNSENEKVKQIDHSVIYRIKTMTPLMKKPVIQCMTDNGKVLFTAKKKDNLIVIGKGSTVHIEKDRSNHVGRISMDNGINNVSCDGQNFIVKFVFLTGPEIFSMETEFTNKGTKVHWKPKLPKFNNQTNDYTLSLSGEYNRRSMKSTKNCVLVNDRDESCFICRKVAVDEFEIECNPRVSQIAVFSLALSQIIGPNPSYSNIIRM